MKYLTLTNILVMEIISVQSEKGRFKQQIVEVSLRKMNSITILNSETLNSQLNKLISTPRTKLVLNMRTISFMDSSGFNCLNLISQIARKYHSEVVLKEVQPELMELIELVKMHGVFDIKKVDIVNLHSEVA